MMNWRRATRCFYSCVNRAGSKKSQRPRRKVLMVVGGGVKLVSKDGVMPSYQGSNPGPYIATKARRIAPAGDLVLLTEKDFAASIPVQGGCAWVSVLREKIDALEKAKDVEGLKALLKTREEDGVKRGVGGGEWDAIAEEIRKWIKENNVTP